ncbi:Non-classical phosphatidylinositol transfer protein (PITP) [Gnomoniopsis smithogilvyi]|uniref:Phosphatidylinositol transfer protein SFH5 n=1 Tax=Gnomoniopsis smithogilvyi TaxID=1191159 RepID=A0A9W8Z508_9PEZI|nr:Non-classical phosphatidylinositol transfer protein (PITP) [Gnomoniopsis smithogilvyi]
MADANTEVPSVEAAPVSATENQSGKSEPPETAAGQNKTTTGGAGTKQASEAPAAASEPAANKDEGSVEPVKETIAGSDKEDKAQAPVDKEAKTDSQTAPPVEAPVAAKETAPVKTPFDQFDAKLPEILKEVDHDEMWGVKLVSPASSHIPTGIVIQKFLNANDGDLNKAVEQFTGALKFRKEKKPLDLVTKAFSANKFADLGAVTVYDVKESPVPEVFTWNLYGNVKGKMDEVFVPLEEFMDYRIALQELGIQQLKLSSATEPITAEKDPYKINQVHDYKSISFLRQNPNVKAASTEVIKKFALAYPELLKEKFFVNVPAIMGWMYAVIKVFIAEKTAKKFHPMANGANLAAEFKASGFDETQLPKEYGGKGGSGDGKMKDIPGLVNELKFE